MHNNIRHRRNKNRRALSFSIFKSNKGFAFGLLALYIFGTILIVVTGLSPDSVKQSFTNFFNDYGVPQATMATSVCNFDQKDLDSIENIEAYQGNIALDSVVKLNDGTLKQFRIFAYEDNEIQKPYFYKRIDYENSQPSVWITKYLAQWANIDVGEDLEINTSSGFKSFKVGAIITITESISSNYDNCSWNEDYDFGYMFIPRDIFDETFHTNNLSNYWKFNFSEGLSEDEKRSTLDEIKNVFGDKVKTAEIYEDSKAFSSFNSTMDALAATCSVFPLCVFIIMLFCSSLFLFQIVNNQRKKIGLLRALGYTPKNITNYFLRFIVVVCLISVVIGFGIGFYISTLAIASYQDSYSIPEMVYVFSPSCFVFLFVLILTGVLSCIFAARGITRVDPSEACEAAFVTSVPYEFKIGVFKNFGVFNKITIAKMLKNKRRLILTSISISACIVLSFASIASYCSKTECLRFIFEDRYHYDLLAYMDPDSNFYDEVSKLDDVDKIEPIIRFEDNFSYEDEYYTFQVNAVPENSELICIFDQNMNRVNPVDGIVIDEYSANVLKAKPGDIYTLLDKDISIDNIFRLYSNPINYVSFQTAKEFGYDKYNACAIKLKTSVSENDFFNQIYDISGFEYLKFLDHQKIVKEKQQIPLDMVFDAIIAIALMIGMIIVLNMVVIIVNERKFEYSTLLALGVEKSRFLKLTTLEYSIQYLIAALISAFVGPALSQIVLDSMSEHLQDFAFVHIPYIYLLSYGLSLTFIIAGIIYTMRKIKKLNPAVELNIRG